MLWVLVLVITTIAAAAAAAARDMPSGQRLDAAGLPVKNTDFLRPFEMRNPNQVAAGVLYQSDILLSEEQWAALRTRKAMVDENYRWTEGSDGYPLVPYIFQDSVDQHVVRAGLDHWMEHTCIKFEETSNTDQPHIQFYIGEGCWSQMGMVYWEYGQQLSIGEGCNSLDIVIHEVGHAIGFNHEQSRSDRDDYVIILMDNVEDGKKGNFVKEADNNYGVPYDYSSNMHYSPTLFSKNDDPTIVAKDPMAQELIGTAIRLTHRDKLLANRMYKCIGKWLTKCGISSDPCLNDGYTGKYCICICPPGTSGSNCEEIVDDYYASQRNPLSEKIITEKSITIETPMDSGTSFVKWIVPPTCKSVKVTFTYSKLWDGACYFQHLNVRVPSDMVGQTMCAADVTTGSSLTSNTGIIITMYNRVNYADYQMTIWEADVTFEHIPGCSSIDPPKQHPTPSPTNPPAPAPTQPPTPVPTPPPPPIVACQKRPKAKLVRKEKSIIITSPNFPSAYPAAKITCGWKLKAPKKSSLNITCDKFALKGKDKLQISTKSFKGNNAPSYTSKKLSIKFKSNKKNSGHGFRCTVVSK